MTQTAAHAQSPTPGFDPLTRKAGDFEYYGWTRPEVAALVPAGSRRVLDVGCGEGAFGAALLRAGATEVVGIELIADVARVAATRLTQVLSGDIETMELPFDPGSFDGIVCADVLEHLRDPLAALRRLRPLLRRDGVLITSIPNVRHASILAMLADGHWTYREQGIMDATHLRFFTRREMEALVAAAGFAVDHVGANMDPAYEEVRRSLPPGGSVYDLSFGRLTVRGLTLADVQDLFVIQYLWRLRPLAG